MIGRKSVLSMISLLIIRFFQGIIFLFAVNHFLPIQFGYVSAATSIMAFFTFFTDLNISSIHFKKMSESEGNRENEFFTVYFVIKISLMLITTIVILPF